MDQHRPGHRQFSVRKAFAAHRPAQKNILQDAHAPFGLRPTPL
jgi:hypothetical protein